MNQPQLGSHDVNVTPLLSPEPDELREIEREFAYLQASSVIESHCVHADRDGAMEFYDTRSAEIDITDEVRYLHARGLLDLHPIHPHWVSVRDDAEPLLTTAEVGA